MSNETKIDGGKTLIFLARLQEDIENISKVSTAMIEGGFNEEFTALIIEYACKKEMGVTKAPSKTQILAVMRGITSIQHHVFKNIPEFEED